MEGRRLGEQIVPGRQGFGGGWNLRDGLWTLGVLQWAVLGENVEKQNMGFCGEGGVQHLGDSEVLRISASGNFR